MPEISAIPVFVKVVEAGSFSKAAEQLNLTKSAVSKRISALESHLGVKLLHRSTRKLSITEAGERYLTHAREALLAIEQAENSVSEMQQTPRGTLRINAPMSFGRLHIAPIIPKFLTAYPHVSLQMEMSDRLHDVVGAGFDITLRGGVLPDSSLVARKVAPLHSVLCASPDYLERHGTPQSPQELGHHNCILYSYHPTLNEWVFVKKEEGACRVTVAGRYQVNNSEALREAIIQGLGIGRLPTFVVGSDIDAGTLIPILTDYRLPSSDLYALYPEKQYLPQKVRVFIDFLVSHLGGDTPYWEPGSKT